MKAQEFVKEVDEAMDSLKNTILTTTELEIPLTLGDHETSIRFVEAHLFDLKVILEMT